MRNKLQRIFFSYNIRICLIEQLLTVRYNIGAKKNLEIYKKTSYIANYKADFYLPIRMILKKYV